MILPIKHSLQTHNRGIYYKTQYITYQSIKYFTGISTI